MIKPSTQSNQHLRGCWLPIRLYILLINNKDTYRVITDRQLLSSGFQLAVTCIVSGIFTSHYAEAFLKLFKLHCIFINFVWMYLGLCHFCWCQLDHLFAQTQWKFTQCIIDNLWCWLQEYYSVTLTELKGSRTKNRIWCYQIISTDQLIRSFIDMV